MSSRMLISVLVLAMALLVPFPGALANAEQDPGEVPDWIAAQVEEQAEIIASLIGLPRTPFVELRNAGPVAELGRRSVHGIAGPERLTITVSGEWNEPDMEARRQLARNLAHEIAHVWQWSLGEPSESRMLHEGFAEAIAVEALIACAAGCLGDPLGLEAKLRRQCSTALRTDILARQDSVEKIYGCGGVLVLDAARSAQLPAAELYRQLAASGRSENAFLTMLEDTAGRGFAVSARSFLNGDYRLAKPSDVMGRLRAGRL